MNWYYVDGGQQAGPVTDEQLEELRRTGKVADDTLVWREGMAGWAPFREAKPAPAAVAAPPGAEPPLPVEVKPGAVCAECGRLFNIEDMIRHGEVYVCAGCKPVFLQKLSEGLVTGLRRGRRSLPVNPDALVNEIVARGYAVNIGSCISRGWDLVKANFWMCVGATFLVMVCNQAAGFVPFVGIILSLIIQGPLLGGLNIFYLRLIRGEAAGLGDAFSGFSKGFWRLCAAFLLMMVLIYVWMIPFAAYFVVAMGRSQQLPGALFWILGSLVVLVLFFVAVSFTFALPLCADLELGPWDALRTSWRIVSRRWFSVFGLLIVAGLLAVLGLVALCIGVFFTLPILYAATLYAYEDIFGAAPASYESGH